MSSIVHPVEDEGDGAELAPPPEGLHLRGLRLQVQILLHSPPCVSVNLLAVLACLSDQLHTSSPGSATSNSTGLFSFFHHPTITHAFLCNCLLPEAAVSQILAPLAPCHLSLLSSDHIPCSNLSQTFFFSVIFCP